MTTKAQIRQAFHLLKEEKKKDPWGISHLFQLSAPEETDLDVGVGFSNEKQEHSFTNFHDKMLVAL
jgi:hypothetical protein